MRTHLWTYKYEKPDKNQHIFIYTPIMTYTKTYIHIHMCIHTHKETGNTFTGIK